MQNIFQADKSHSRPLVLRRVCISALRSESVCIATRIVKGLISSWWKMFLSHLTIISIQRNEEIASWLEQQTLYQQSCMPPFWRFFLHRYQNTEISQSIDNGSDGTDIRLMAGHLFRMPSDAPQFVATQSDWASFLGLFGQQSFMIKIWRRKTISFSFKIVFLCVLSLSADWKTMCMIGKQAKDVDFRTLQGFSV